MTIHINLFAGPGVGKSTTAAGVFYYLKRAGFNIELISEYAKDLVFQNKIHEVDSLHILENQYLRESMVHGKTDYCITDAPLVLNYAYASEDMHQQITDFLNKNVNWKTVNFLLHRNLNNGYQNQGRYQSKEEAIEFHENILVPTIKKYVTKDLFVVDLDEHEEPSKHIAQMLMIRI